MKTIILRERVLSDNTLYIAEENKIFKGGYVALLKEYTFANAWCDKESVKRFRSKERLTNYLSRNYAKEELYFVEL
jgi:hypothetical protein